MKSIACAIFFALAFTAPLFAQTNPTPTAPANALVWDSETKTYAAKPGDAIAPFVFNLTNVSSAEVVITSVHTSCGCTVAQLPEQPWHLAPGTNGQIKVTVNLAGKMGHVTKQVTVNSSAGVKYLLVNVDIPPAAPAAAENMRGDRNANMALARGDRQAVFKGDCAKCHVEKGVGKMGRELFAADCGICHDSPRRAAMVPDLRAPKTLRDHAFWVNWIEHGKVGSMMPAFAQSEGGPLTQAQIDSLVSYLSQNYPQAPAGIAAPKLPPVPQ
jgi:mono/diheme cytochrome c family protein